MGTAAKPVAQGKQAATPAPKSAASAPATRVRRVLTPEQQEQVKRERAAKFMALARPRLARVLKGMKQLENLGRGQYEYTQANADNLLKHLVDGVGRVKVAFAPKVRGSKAAQELPEL